MKKPTKLYSKLMIFGVLVLCLWLFDKPQPVTAVTLCSACIDTWNADLVNCNQLFGVGGPGYYACLSWAMTIRDECLLSCTGPGGGGGGGTGKTGCQLDCYDQRIDCRQNGGYGTEECLASGETLTYCCHQVFEECMAACE